MKRLLIASAALALLGAGSAMAQVTPPASSIPASPATTTATPPAPTADASQPAAMPDPATSQAAMPSAPVGETASTQGAVVGDLAQANPPPAKYPPCTNKKQDRCIVMAQVKRHSSATARSGA